MGGQGLKPWCSGALLLCLLLPQWGLLTPSQAWASSTQVAKTQVAKAPKTATPLSTVTTPPQTLKPLQAKVFTLPVGTSLHFQLNQPLSSETATEGQPFEGRLTQAVQQNNYILLPEGTVVQGEITVANATTAKKGNAKLGLKLTQLVVPTSSKPIALNAPLQTAKGTNGVLQGDNDTAKTVGGVVATGAMGAATGAAAGALAGVLRGAISTGTTVGRGAATGSIIGAGVGLAIGIFQGISAAKAAGSSLKPVELQAGTPLSAVLNTALYLNSTQIPLQVVLPTTPSATPSTATTATMPQPNTPTTAQPNTLPNTGGTGSYYGQ